MRYASMLALVALCACQSPPAAEPPAAVTDNVIDERSYQLGVIGAFAEVVGVGVKKLALSSAMSPDDMAGLLEEAEKIVERNNAQSFLEIDFLVTDLFPVEVTEGKHVLFIYLDPVKDEYMSLKTRKQKLIDDGQYEGEVRKEIAREMGRLLSYPEERIEAMLAE